MKITYIGLSCFLIENANCDRILVDAYKDDPAHNLGICLPDSIEADLFLSSHPDADHSELRQEWMRKRRDANEKDASLGVAAFPELNLRGTLVKEYNGDLNIAWAYSIDGMRLLHLADNSHLLTQGQLEEIGQVDIVFLSPPKVAGTDYHLQNAAAIKAGIIIPCHFMPVCNSKGFDQETEANLLFERMKLHGYQNPNVTAQTARTLVQMYLQAWDMADRYPGSYIIPDFTVDITEDMVKGKQRVFLFTCSMGK